MRITMIFKANNPFLFFYIYLREASYYLHTNIIQLEPNII